jgi:uncharacterized protein (TIGR03435 family)
MRELSVYALEAARADGLLGPQIQRLDVDCVEIRAARQRGDAQAPRASGPGRSVDPCFTSTMLGAATRLESGGLTMEQLASTLSRSIGRPVLDRTGLTGYFALTLEFAGEPGARTPFGFVGPGGSAEPADAPSVFSAVQDQLGLRLEPRREMMDVLVIESAHLPAEN